MEAGLELDGSWIEGGWELDFEQRVHILGAL